MKTYSDTLFAQLRSRGWNIHLLAYSDRDNRRRFCADAQRADGSAFIARADSILGALLELDSRCRVAERKADFTPPPTPGGHRSIAAPAG